MPFHAREGEGVEKLRPPQEEREQRPSPGKGSSTSQRQTTETTTKAVTRNGGGNVDTP